MSLVNSTSHIQPGSRSWPRIKNPTSGFFQLNPLCDVGLTGSRSCLIQSPPPRTFLLSLLLTLFSALSYFIFLLLLEKLLFLLMTPKILPHDHSYHQQVGIDYHAAMKRNGAGPSSKAVRCPFPLGTHCKHHQDAQAQGRFSPRSATGTLWDQPKGPPNCFCKQ